MATFNCLPTGGFFMFFFLIFNDFCLILSRIRSECQTVLIQVFVGPDMGPNCLQKLSADDWLRLRMLAQIHQFCAGR